MAGLNGSSLEALGGGRLRGSGHAEDRALTTVRRPTRYFFSRPRADIPARASRRIAAYSSTFEGGMGDAPPSQGASSISPQVNRCGQNSPTTTSPEPECGQNPRTTAVTSHEQNHT
jgi:hypothetical protein